MKARELADALLQYPDFDVCFSFGEPDGGEWGYTVRTFDDISIKDIGHSDKVLALGGAER